MIEYLKFWAAKNLIEAIPLFVITLGILTYFVFGLIRIGLYKIKTFFNGI